MAERARNGKVTVVGAGFYGSTTALRLAEYDVFETVVLTDIVEGKPEGLALDMNQSRPIEGFETTVVGRRRRLLRGHRGLRRRRHHRRPAAQARHEPDGPASRPTPSIVRAGRREHRADLAGRRRHRGVQPAGRDDRAGPAGHRLPAAPGDGPGRHAGHRAVHQQRRRGARRPGRLGAHADPRARTATRWCRCPRAAPSTASRWPTCSPPTGSSTSSQRTRNGGAEVVALLKTGSAYYAPSAAAARMARAVIEDSGAVMPVCAWVDGEYGISGVYLGVEAEIGRAGRAAGRRGRPDRQRAGRAARGGRGRARQAGRRRRPLRRTPLPPTARTLAAGPCSGATMSTRRRSL